MKVKYIEVHGFKSFALPTRLEFDSGIAAIVGPNGSGKSNLVEAVRWVLGEQSYSQLRGRRTEDVIWGGGGRHAQAGMGEVSITFDNSDRSLPIPYSEVTVTRRAYRSGENEYMINRSRVRLRDVTELTSAIGQGYTVVSQGTADAVLSLSPQGRRGLFEEAADITQHYSRRDEALRRLSQMDANATRVADLLAELQPRLKTLARQARQYRERQAVEARLRELLVAFYSSELRRSDESLRDARTGLYGFERQIGSLKSEAGEVAAREAVLRETELRHDRELSSLEQALREKSTEETVAARETLIAESRVSHLRQGHDSSRRQLSAALAARGAAREERDETQRSLSDAQRELEGAAAELQAFEDTFSAASESREAALRAVEALRAESLGHEEEATRARNKVALLRESLESSAREMERRQSDEEAQAGEHGNAEATVQVHRQELEAALAKRDESLTALQSARSSLRDCAQRIAALRAEGSEKESAAREQRARLTLLTEMHETGVGLNRGVQVVQRAAAAGKLEGIVGSLGSLLQVPQRFEQAIEAVMGGALQNIVVRQWRHAEQAIALLKKSGAGRVTFLPLDTLRAAPSPRVPLRPGIIGLAADLITYPAEIQPAARHALGRVLMVDDLPTARSLVSEMSRLSAVVTLGGETLRPGGSLTGGARARESGILARERELRELPELIERLESEGVKRHGSILQAERRHDNQAAIERRQASHRDACEHRRRDTEAALNEALRVLERASQQRDWFRASALRAAEEHGTLRARLAEAQREQATADSAAREAADRLHEAAIAAGDLERESRETAAELATLRTRLAVSAERARSEQTRHQRAKQQLQSSDGAVSRQEQLVLDAQRQLGQAEPVAAEAQRRQERLRAGLDEMDAALAPLRAELQKARREREQVRTESDRLAADLQGAEERRLGAALRVQRLEVAHESLSERARQEMGDEPPDEEPEPPPDIDRQIRLTRDRLTRIGPVNPLAAQEYDEISGRSEFMETQLADMEVARRDLQQVIEALEEQMERRFTDTFSLVSHRFGQHFERLFNGGTAQLALVTREDTVGIEIQAQPPGKRLGNLSALSGGERALTSCALLFALITAGGAPFCVLDEVDAALDESNVGRFCDLLEEIGRETQFIVVTHNRGTIERAGRLYGISMEASGLSKVLSLHLDGEESARASA